MKPSTRILAVCLASVTLALAAPSKIAKDLLKADPNAIVDVIVQFTTVPSDKHHQKIRNQGGTHKAGLELVKGGLYSVPVHALTALANDPEIVYMSLNRPVPGMLDTVTATAGANVAWQAGFTGTGVGVAVIDSGITDADDFQYANSTTSRIVYSESFTGLGTNDAYGHGTHVAGIIGSVGKNSSGPNALRTFKGVAPNVQLISLKVLDGTGVGTDSAVISAIQRAIQLKSTYNIRVINLSLGRQIQESYKLDPLCQAVEQAWKAGIVVVVAAGNKGRDNSMNTSGYSTIMSPGNDPYVITVGAMKTMGTPARGDDLIASYSSKGPSLLDHVVKPDLLAPGNMVVSTLVKDASLFGAFPGNEVYRASYIDTAALNVSNTYYKLSGTSMAAPVVSGAAALLIQKDPTLTPDTIKARLMKTATKTFPASSSVYDAVTGITYTSYYDIFTVGAGYLDIAAALSNTDVVSSPAVSPTANYDPLTGQISLVNSSTVVWGTNVVWGTTVVWGTNVVWGSNVVWGTNIVWGTTVVWGTSTAAGFTVVWGTNVVWGTGTTTGQVAPSGQSIALNGEL